MSRKEYMRNYMREYYKKNKPEPRTEYHREYMKEYRKKLKETNPNKLKEEAKKRYEKQLDGHYSVYLLEDYNYVGYTNCLYWRFANHKSKKGRDCTNHRVLYKTKDISEAKELEALLHDMGYEGKYERQ